MLRKTPTNRSGLLHPQVKWNKFLAPLKPAKLCPLDLVDDGQAAGDRFSNYLDFGELRRSATCHLRNTQTHKFILEVIQLLEQLGLALAAELVHFDLGHCFPRALV
eukprot:EC120158.1.p1 GENE.EC120158.1~~EC120158.1.p1  ORF type:complete len:106 (-),score=18.56 EC120158.1:52-369(-)